MQGWISLHRKFKDSPIYTDSHAVHLWVHLLLKANHKDKVFIHSGKEVTIKRGQLLTGRKRLSEETGIQESKIFRLLSMFERHAMIEQLKTNKYSIISISKFDEYQAGEQQVNNKRTTDEQQVNTNNNVNNVDNDNKTSIGRFAPPSQADVANYMIERGCTISQAQSESQRLVDFYGSKGWMVGKNKMKDWKAATRNWLSRNGGGNNGREISKEYDIIGEAIKRL